ncbi:hypothetical protein HY572_05570 [Candidatus Micrarchaeota archaeon]|nr:hypothetical protein [Candidatus Micrarchaeota archaeon]
MVLFFHLPASIERKFREKAMQKYGYSKGALKKAMEDAIEDWLAKNTEATPPE